MTKFWHPELSVIETDDIGPDCTIHAFVWIGPGVKIGARCKIQAFVFIPPDVTIGNDVFIGPHAVFTNDKHPPSPISEPSVVEDEVAIGAGAIILPGLTLHRGCIIGAGAVVTHDVPAGATVMGIPAR